VAAAAPLTLTRTLGESLIDVSERRGTLATVYGNRIEATAALASSDAGVLLGRTMAHEIGHLLLGTRSHSRRGLMRALWTDDELRRDERRDWTLSHAEGAAMRRRLASLRE
jgi:hypothetical protein